MNFKKYILLVLATLFLSVPSFAEKNDFFGESEEVVSGAGKFSDELLEAWSKFDDNVLDVASVGKQNWKTFQNRVAEQLQNLHPGKKIGNQITLDVTYIENGITKTKT